MWIKIAKDIFENADFKGLNYIYSVLSWFPKTIPRYKIFIDQQTVEQTENYQIFVKSDLNFKNLIDQQFNEFIQSQPSNSKVDYIVTNQKGINCFNIEESIRYFSQPISIILENNKNDAYFIKAIINHFDSSNILAEYLENGWIKFENAGGCSNVKNFIEGELKAFEDIASRNQKETFHYYKAFVLLDSDLEFPSQNQKPQYTTLIDYLKTIDIGSEKFHLLEKRMMENYMPDEVFLALRDEYRSKNGKKELLAWISSYLSLTDEQKDFINIKDGFSKEKNVKGERIIKPEVKYLYSTVVGQNYTNIDNGFRYPDFKNSFSELFHKSDRINKASLKRRANSEELTIILQKIKKLI
ncbi:hypothetical protein [Elizabethkingia bruuniana]|uniref:hypothetical protein n=1 Tax=Elizabethkingia bruuniana TaxID=1756149 RepID=UPI00241CFD67|nr:hypothetical protein [Elizabethkingia bruuniana]